MTFTDGNILYASELNAMLTDISDNASDISSNTSALNAINETLTAGESVVSGDLCYLKDDGKMWKADADAEATADTMLGLATASISADATGNFLIKGRHTTSGLTVGALQYVSTTAGALTETAPSASGDIVRIAGSAISATVLYFDPDKTFIEV